jgi:hypothetical protein
MKRVLGAMAALALAALLPLAAVAQTTTPAAPAAAPPAAEMQRLLAEVEAQSGAALSDLAGLRINRWRAGDAQKDEARQRALSLERNLRSALPALLEAARQSPEGLAPGFRLYRNLSALYDVMALLAESAAAAGARDDFEALGERARSFDQTRRSLADRLEALAEARDQELGRLRAAERTRTSPPRKIVIDDRQPAPKPAAKPARKP